jgi:two-component system OmpR family sensor kinase
MSIRLKLTFLNTAILISALILFGSAVYAIVQSTIHAEIDNNLEEIARQVRSETEAFALGNVTVLSIPEELDVFHTASVFIVVLDKRGEIIARSSNLAGFERMLDSDGPADDRRYSTVMQDGQNLRVLTVPLVVDTENGQEQIGHMQVAQLVDSYPLVYRLPSILLLTGAAAVCLSLLLGVLATNNLLRPLDDIAAVALQITRADDLSRRLPDPGRHDEIGKLTEVLNQTLARLERLFRSQQRFLADVSHELRTPLTTIRGNIDLMRRMSEADPESLDVIQDEVERMTRLVGDLLLLARADTGGLPIRREPVELDSVFLDVYRQVSLLAKGVDVVIQEVDQACVIGDVDRLKQLLLNLIDNAIKYTSEGGTVRMSLSKKDGMAELAVADTGIGIPPADLPFIFDRFYRVDKARTRVHGGSGLGLSIARWIAQAHNGDIHVKSEVGVGSTFTVMLPITPDGYQNRDNSKMRGSNGSEPARRPVELTR